MLFRDFNFSEVSVDVTRTTFSRQFSFFYRTEISITSATRSSQRTPPGVGVAWLPTSRSPKN